MKFLSDKDDISDLEKDCKNKFRFEWLFKKDILEEVISVWCRKIDTPGTCFCIACNTSIKYQNEGFKSLTNHSATVNHKKCRQSVKNSQILNSLYPGSENLTDESRTVDLATRKSRAEALVLSFLAEHSIPFSLAPQIVELTKTLSRDPMALNSLDISRTTASYKLKYGLAKTIKENQYKVLKNSFFSLNIDESTNRASESILAILVRYFAEDQQKVILRHLASIKLPACNAECIHNAILSIFEENGLPFKNLISVLMDSCNTMRGKKNGVETKIRSTNAPHLLDIDGETCHIANNCSKHFTEPFLKHLEILCDNIYFDLKSADKRELFFQVCSVLGMKLLKPLSRPDHRWLYMLQVLDRLQYLWDALLIFYFSWIGSDKMLYESDLNEVFSRRQLSNEEVKSLQTIQFKLEKKHITDDGKNRKRRIIQRIFIERKKTLLQIGVYQAVLPHFNKYVKLFQSNECLLHELHVQMFNLTKQFFAFFLKHEFLRDMKSYQEVLMIDPTNPENYLPDRLIFSGVDAQYSEKTDPTVQDFLKVLKKSYSNCASYMQKKLPLSNPLLIKFSALNPTLRGETTTFTALMKLAELLPNVISKQETLSLDLELRRYQTDDSLTSYESKPMMEYWSKVIELKEGNLKKYPVLSKMIKALVTCFHRPSVESTFNLMDDIMSEKRTSMNIETIDSIQTIKYYLSSLNSSTCEVFGSKDPAHEPIDREFAHNLIYSWSNYQQSLLKTVSNTVSESNTVHVSENHINSPSSSKSSVQIEKHCDSLKENRKRKLPLDSQKESNINKSKQTKLSSFFKK